MPKKRARSMNCVPPTTLFANRTVIVTAFASAGKFLATTVSSNCVDVRAYRR